MPMPATSTLEQFLITTTGLPQQQIRALYQAGYPWPLMMARTIRKAELLAQAKGLPMSDALAAVDAETNAEITALLAQPSGSRIDRLQMLLSLPWLREIHDHIEAVAVRTGTPPRVVYLLSTAIQEYTLLHPEWVWLSACVDRQPS